MSTMIVKQVQVYCEECKKSSWIEMDEENFTWDRKNGLEYRTISHGNHILLLEIDQEFSVRNEKVVKLISSVVENIVVQTVEQILLYSYKFRDLNKLLLYISDSQAFNDFFKSVLSILMLNLKSNTDFSSNINKEGIQFNLNGLKIIQCESHYISKHSINKELASLVIDIDTIDVKAIDTKHLIDLAKNCKIIIAYNSKKKNNIPEKMVNKFLSKGFSRISLFDYSSSKGLKQIIDDGFNNLDS